jgi:hypothetical protein
MFHRRVVHPSRSARRAGRSARGSNVGVMRGVRVCHVCAPAKALGLRRKLRGNRRYSESAQACSAAVADSSEARVRAVSWGSDPVVVEAGGSDDARWRTRCRIHAGSNRGTRATSVASTGSAPRRAPGRRTRQSVAGRCLRQGLDALARRGWRSADGYGEPVIGEELALDLHGAMTGTRSGGASSKGGIVGPRRGRT